jgi:hypothetical protein
MIGYNHYMECKLSSRRRFAIHVMNFDWLAQLPDDLPCLSWFKLYHDFSMSIFIHAQYILKLLPLRSGLSNDEIKPAGSLPCIVSHCVIRLNIPRSPCYRAKTGLCPVSFFSARESINRTHLSVSAPGAVQGTSRRTLSVINFITCSRRQEEKKPRPAGRSMEIWVTALWTCICRNESSVDCHLFCDQMRTP